MMSSVDFLCLAYSMKHGGRCVAGLRLDTNEWVRPVSSAEDGTLTQASCTLDIGRPIRPLDVARLRLKKPRPEPHQPENWVIDDDQWELVNEVALDDVADDLDSVTDGGPGLLGTAGTSIGWEAIQKDGVQASLGIVRVRAPRFEVNDWNRLRARFVHDGSSYDLSCTDMAPWATAAFRGGGVHPATDWYLTVSLGEPWEETNRCYKLVACGLEIV